MAETKTPAVKKTATKSADVKKVPEKAPLKKEATVKASAPKEKKAPAPKKVVETKASAKEVAASKKPVAKKGNLKIKLIKGLSGRKPSQVKTLKALGLYKINQVVSKPDNEAIRGMIKTVEHLVELV